ncbi:G domain-containing protein [Mycena sanguinolenta]|uniref:G domain-containing protein n=1 Tax=Mycena sanguinolenta TaxID=230812 RepID=A0A8H6YGT3_9AGAR|nr:G domain-containing protein [Mycena sanguinolenta]
MSTTGSEDFLVPYTEILRQECPRLRILVVGKACRSGAGKSALINAVFGIEGATPVSHRTPGVHDIDKPLSFPQNDRIIIHDSQGFEPGEEGNIQTVLDFIDRRSKKPALADQLHAIWVCAEIPFAGGRLFERGVERILLEYRGNLPIIVVFTKLDVLRVALESKLEKELEQRDEEMEDDEFEAALDTRVTSRVQDLCVKPLCDLTPSEPPKWVATSTTDPRYKPTIADLVNLALELTKIENVWIEMAIAQRTSAQASIDASVRVGRKRYWRGLISDIFLGFTMRNVLEVLQKDIVNVWNMHDPEKHLQKPEFLALLSVLVEDISDEATSNYPLTERAVKAIIDNPAAIIVAGPTAVVVLFAEWVRGTFKKTKSSIRCLIAFIVDLTLTMDTLFYLVLSRGQTPIKIALVNSALRIYNSRKAPVHASIKAWVDGWGTFGHLDADVVIKKIACIIADNSVKPEQWGMKEEECDESWMALDALRARES